MPRFPAASSAEATVLVQLPAVYVPMLVRDLEGRKMGFAWESDEEWKTAYEHVCRLQEYLLMDIAERFIMEVRASRGGDVITEDVRNPESDPFNLPLETLAGLNNNLNLVRGKLEEVRAAIAAQEFDSEGIIRELGQIALLLA